MDEAGSILIVDDNPNNLQMLAAILQKDGFRVRPALSGELALRAAHSQAPDLILLDVRMPGMDGYETCRHLKEAATLRDIPVIFISALTEIEEKLHAFNSGAVDYITKPFQSDEVLARVRTQMELASTRKSLTATNARLLALMEHLVQVEKRKSVVALARGVAHELNTPLGNALLCASSIDEALGHYTAAREAGAGGLDIDDVVATCRNGTQIILRNLYRAGRLIDALSDVSVDAGHEQRRVVLLRDIVSNLTGAMAELRGGGPTVVLDIDPALAIETYPGRLQQLLEHLIENAATHAFDGLAPGTIRISAHGRQDGRVGLTVADDGKGIAPQDLPRIFDPCFTSRLGEGGKGLGLFTACNIATEILGGTLAVASTEGGGATFTLDIPVVAPAERAGAAAGG